MNEFLEQLSVDPWGRLVLQHVATGGLCNTYLFLLVSARLAGVFVVAPCFHANVIHFSVRIGLVILLSLIVAPSLSRSRTVDDTVTFVSHESVSSATIPATAIELGLVIASEIGLGTMLGMGVLCVLSGLRLGGEWLDRHCGLGMGAVMNPDWFAGGSACSSLTQLLGIAAFLLIGPIGGPLLLLQSLIESFNVIPAGVSSTTMSTIELLNGLVQQSFVLALRIAMPLVAAMTLVDIALAFAGRGAPMPFSSSFLAIRAAVSLMILALTMTVIPEIVATATLSMLRFLGSAH